MKTNLVIACYGGERRVDDEVYRNDRGVYLRDQINSLTELQHSLTQITLVNNKIWGEKVEYLKAFWTGPKKIRNTEIVRLERLNSGASYGVFNFAFEKYKDEFDYYIFLEDDQIIVEPEFDKKLIELYESYKNCGYLCGLIYDTPVRHAALSFGIARFDVLNKVYEDFGRLHQSDERDYSAAVSNQIEFSAAFEKLGYKLYQLIDHYQIAYLETHTSQISWFGSEDKPIFMVPQQLTKGGLYVSS